MQMSLTSTAHHFTDTTTRWLTVHGNGRLADIDQSNSFFLFQTQGEETNLGSGQTRCRKNVFPHFFFWLTQKGRSLATRACQSSSLFMRRFYAAKLNWSSVQSWSVSWRAFRNSFIFCFVFLFFVFCFTPHFLVTAAKAAKEVNNKTKTHRRYRRKQRPKWPK